MATFRAYTEAQGASYAAGRPGYAPKLFEIVVDHHTKTGGQRGLVVDVGCGTGQATRDLAPYFEQAVGLDPSAGMIASAREQVADRARSIPATIRFDVSAAEDLGTDLDPRPFADGTVDLLAAATAAHWFDLDRFWPRAAQVLRPGGTVALWARTGMTVDPSRTPNGSAVRAVVDEVYQKDLAPHDLRGSILTRDLYVDLPLPWTIVKPVEDFDKASFVRRVWGAGDKSTEDDEEGMGTKSTISLEEFARLTATNSTVTRWREAHPGEEDVVERMKRRIATLLHEAGVKPGEEVLGGQVSIVLLLVKKKQ